MYKLYTFVVISCISSFFVYNISDKKIDKEIISINDNNQEIEIINDESIIEEPVKEKEKNIIEKDNLEKELMTIEIPKIKLKGKIYNYNSNLNNIDKNIIIMKESDLPNIDGGILIIGAHSGYGKYAYFKDLNKLEKNDEIIINYLNNNYVYKVVDYHLDKKDGSISINNVNKKNKLFLYTCNPNDKNNYLVYDCEII